jgi:phosphatidylinositol alpha-1,6-mannosyltransferase
VDGKGYALLTQLLPRILQAIPDLIWVIVGEGPQKAKIVRLTQEYSVQSVVRFLGRIPYTELPKIYQLADVFVLLTHAHSNAEEGWGTVFLEAAAMGVPVIAGRAGGVEEAVEHGITGLVVDTENTEQVIATIVELFKNNRYAQQLGTQAQKRAQEEFVWKKQLLKLNI